MWKTGCLRDSLGNRVMHGWERQNWLHGERQGESQEVLVDRTENIIALRSWGDGEVFCGTQADVSIR